MHKKLLVMVLLLSLVISSCGEKVIPPDKDSNNETSITPDIEPTETPNPDDTDIDTPTEVVQPTEEDDGIKEIDYEVIKPYEVGHIMVIMYHGIKDDPPYHRLAEDFTKDLQYMYDNGYRLIAMSDYINGYIDVEAGYTPIVLTFDDGLSSTFSLETLNGELVPKQGTAIALLEAFTELHPDFGTEAILYINGGKTAFDGAGSFEERLNWLVDHGYELGNHTNSHPKLNKLTGDEVQEEIGKVDAMIKKAVPGITVNSISYPHGIRPEEIYRQYATDGTYEGNTYHYDLGLREGVSGSMVSPLHIKFDPYNCPRVRGSEGAEGDLWWWFDYYEEHQDYKYISDGNSDRIAVPTEYADNVNQDKRGDYELFLY